MGTHLEPAHGLRALGAGYVALGLIGLVTETLLSVAVDGTVVGLALLAMIAGVALGVLARVRPSARLLEVGVVAAAGIVSVALPNTQEVAANALVYLIPVAFAAYCLPPAGLALIMFVIAVGFALALDIPTRGVAVLDRWIICLGSLSIAATLLVQLRRRIDLLVAELERTSVTDALTGLLNRRGFEGRLAAELAEHGRRGASLGLLVADVDHFKATNDRLGHAGGDAVLQCVARTLADAARAGDVVARVGGEEFAVLLPDTDERSARDTAERLRAAVHRATDGTTTVSIGAGTTDDSDGADLLLRTDRALYAAKDAGRDRVAAAA